MQDTKYKTHKRSNEQNQKQIKGIHKNIQQSDSSDSEIHIQKISNDFKQGDQYNPNQQQMILTFKVKQLQKMCKSLGDANMKLLNRIHDLEGQNNNSIPFIDEFSQMQNQFSQIQGMIHQYREYLDGYQGRLAEQLKQKNIIIEQLKEQLTQNVQNNATLTLKNLQIQQANENLIRTNQNLLMEIQTLKQHQNSRLKKNRNSIYRQPSRNSQKKLDRINGGYQLSQIYSRQSLVTDSYYRKNDYQSMAQQQLQILIQKLVEELQHQKKLKKKMYDQIKRMSQQLKQYQKQIMEKNNKIYYLELNQIRNNRNLRISKSVENQDQDQNWKPFSEENKVSQSRTLMNFLDKEQIISITAKMHIAKKIINFYQKKIAMKDYSHILLEDLQITNFNQKNLNLIGINKRKSQRNHQTISQKSIQNLIWNMAFILDNLFNQIPQYEQATPQWFKKIKEDILELIESILGSKSPQRQSMVMLKKLIDRSLKIDR